ncbi:NACHT domain- and WD repeat-containing protein 1-like isoform X1 [Patiria miniata]|uniref:NACHT and WD repeat domain-containing protein 1 n=2 Tax=Patiria miniata TaxID=46514 RepID=A0A914BU29_PATMI|nr:NACHT domain- and WD repeat-containing protein 1-like isoform X1 [Patiria miniata]
MADSNYPEGFEWLVQGKTTKLPSQDSNVVRVFLSSTFTDTIHERNRLLKDVFPELQKYCQGKGLDFEVVDMRWGVRDNATADHLTSALCIKEIETCKRLSMGPHFVGFLGNKYGYRPLPPVVESAHFEKLTCSVQSLGVEPDESQLLANWYVQDTNATPPVHVLQPITSRLPNFYNAEQPELQQKERDDWWKTFGRLQRLLQRGARAAVKEGLITEEESAVYFESVTEIEVREGLKGVVDPSASCLFFLRDLEGLGVKMEDEATRRYLDIDEDGSVDSNAQTSLKNLKTNYLPSILGEEAIHRFSLPWTPSGIDPSHPVHAQYLDDICNRFRDGIRGMIDRSLEQRSKVTDQAVADVYEELLHHAEFCDRKCSVFHGRQELMTNIRDFLSLKPGRPLVVHGVSGSGKTSVMAMLAKNACDWLKQEVVVVLRFLGTSGQSSGIHAVLQSVCRQICYAYNLKQPCSTTLGDYTDLTKLFRKLVATVATQEKPLLLIFDSIDQLSAANDAHAVNWLPMSVPSHVLIVASMLSLDEHRCQEKMRLLLADDSCYLEMQPVPQETGLEILNSWLEVKRRKLTEEQLIKVSEAFSKCPQPLFLKLLFENVLHWKSYTGMSSERRLPTSVREAITDLFEELEHKHGQIVISHALGYISAAKSGITEAEIEDVLSCDDEVLNDVYQYWDPPAENIVRTPPSLWKRIHYDVTEFLSERQSGGKTVVAWYHRQFIEAADDRYLIKEEIISARHQLLAEMFLGSYSVGKVRPITLHKRSKVFPEADRQVAPQPLEFSNGVYNRRKLIELPHHLAEAGMLEELVSHVLCNFNWLLTKLVSFSFLELMLDFRPLTEEIIILIETMYLASSNLKVDPFSLAGQLIGRIGDYGSKYPNLEKLIQQAKDWIRSTKLPVFVPSAPCLIPPGGPLRTVFGGHPSLVLRVMCTPSGELMLSACLDSEGHPMFNVWNMSTLEVVHTLQKKNDKSPLVKNSKVNMCISQSSRYALFGKNSLALFDLVTGECLRELDTDGLTSFSNLTFDEKDSRVFACAEPGNVVCIWSFADGQKIASMQHPAEAIFITTLSSGEDLLSVCRDGKLRVWSLKSQECVMCQTGYDEGKMVACAALTPGASHLVTGSSDGLIKIWSVPLTLPSSAESITLESEITVSVKEPLLSIVPHSDTTFVLRDSSSVSRIIHLVPERDPTVLDLKGHDGLITCVWTHQGVAGDGDRPSFVVTGSKDDTLKVWSLDDGRCLNTLKGHSSWISDVTVLTMEDGPRVLSACNDKTVKMWIPTKGEVTKRDRHELSVLCNALFKGTSSLIGVSGSKDKQTKFWNLDDARCFKSVSCASVAMEILEPQEMVVCGTDTGEVVAFQLETGSEVWRWPLFKKSIAVIALAARQTVLVCSKEPSDKSIRVCDGANQLEEKFRLVGHAEATTILRSVVGEENPMYLSASKMAGEIKAWDDVMGNCLTTMMHEQVMSMEVSPNSKFLATGSNKGTVKVWSLGRTSLGSLMAELTGLYNDTIVCLAFDRENRYLVSGAHTGQDQLLIWDFQGNKKRYLVGHTHAVMSVSVTVNNKYVFSSSRDCTIKAWSLESADLLASFDCQSQVKFFKFVEFAEDHYRFIATNQSGTIAMLDLLLEKAERGKKDEQGTRQSMSLPPPRSEVNGNASNGSTPHTNGSNDKGHKRVKKMSKVCVAI